MKAAVAFGISYETIPFLIGLPAVGYIISSIPGKIIFIDKIVSSVVRRVY